MRNQFVTELTDAEHDQLAREPYVPQWLKDEAAAIRKRQRDMRRLRWTVAFLLFSIIVAAVGALR